MVQRPEVASLPTDSFDLILPSSLLERFTALLVARPSLEVVLEETYQGLFDLIDLDFLSLISVDGGKVVPVVAVGGAGRGDDLVTRLEPLSALPVSGWLERVALSPRFVDDLSNDAIGAELCIEAASLGFLPLPAMGSGSAGLLLVGRVGQPRPWSVTEQRTLVAVSRVVAACLGQSQSTSAPDRAVGETIALLTLSRLLENVNDAGAVRRAALESLRPHFPGASLGFLTLEGQSARLLDFDGDELLVRATGLLEGYRVSDPRLRKAMADEGNLFLEQYGHGPQADARLTAAGVAMLALVPLHSTRGLLGGAFGLCALRRTRRRPWSELERRLLTAAARTITVALERVEASRQLAEARERAEFLAALSDALQGAHTVEEVAETAMRWLGPALRAENILTLRVNEAVTAMASWGEIPSNYRGYFDPLGLPLMKTRLTRDLVQSGQPIYEMSYQARGGTNEARLIAVGLEPVKDHFGRVLAIFSVARDPSLGPWQQSERDLMARAAATVGLAFERAQVREQLEAQNRALAEKSAEMESFVYSVSHDLKAPMVSLEGMSTLLMEALEEGNLEEVAFFVSRLRANVSTMGQLVNNLLELSRVGRVDEADEMLEVGPVVRGVLDELEGQIKFKGIVIEAPQVWPVLTYPPARFYQVWANLVGNAVKFMPPRLQSRAEDPGPRIRLAWSVTADTLEFRVSDNGPGIPENLRAKVFELFSRLNPEVQGSGVGLTMVKAIIETKGGMIRLEDGLEDRGLTVVFTVPFNRAVSLPVD